MNISKVDTPSGNAWRFGEIEVILPGSVETEQEAAAWWADHSHELDADYRPVRAQDVHAERDRRLTLGFDYDFGDARGVHRIGTTEADMRGWQEVSTASSAAIAVGQGEYAITILTNTGPAEITAIEWQAILLAAANFRQPIWQASFALEHTDPIPADFASDQHWP